MLKRIITAVTMIASVLPILIFSHMWIFPCAIAAISVMCLFEVLRCIGMHKRILMTLPLYICALGFPILLRLINNDFLVAGIAIIAIIFYIAYTFTWTIFSHGKITYPEICTLCLTSFYVIFAMNTILYVRDYKNYGKYVFALILVAAWVTDTFAYFTGRLLGKHKLVPDVSPKKTIEGSIGGVIFCAIGFLVTGAIVDAVDPDISLNYINYIYLAVSGVLMSIISQAGDLIMSVIKRHYGIKDFSNMLPGHGGMLDRMDSTLAVALGVEMLIMFTYLTGISLF